MWAYTANFGPLGFNFIICTYSLYVPQSFWKDLTTDTNGKKHVLSLADAAAPPGWQLEFLAAMLLQSFTVLITINIRTDVISYQTWPGQITAET